MTETDPSEDIARKMVVVIEIDDIDPNAEKARRILNEVKPIFSDRGDVRVYGAVREHADAILDILKNGSLDG